MNKTTEKPASLPGQVQTIVSCPVCQRGDIWHEAVNRTEYVYKGESVKDGQEVIDYLLAEVRSMLEQAANNGVTGVTTAGRNVT